MTIREIIKDMTPAKMVRGLKKVTDDVWSYKDENHKPWFFSKILETDFEDMEWYAKEIARITSHL